MKHLYLFLLLLLSLSISSFSQTKEEKSNGVFYKVSIASTLRVNEENTLFTDDDEPFFNFSALFVNNTIGYQFDKRAAIGLNFEYNWHSEQGLHFFPAYLSFQYNIYVNDSDLFIRGGYGSLLGMSKDFQKGNLYKTGIGIRTYINDDYSDSILIGFDFTRKRFGYRTLEGLSSFSIFIEFMLF